MKRGPLGADPALRWCVVGLSLILAAVALLWRGPKSRVGDVFGATFTVVPEELTGSQCALSEPIAGCRCRFVSDREGNVVEPEPDGSSSLAYFWTTNRQLLLVDGLPKVPEIARAMERQRLLPRGEQRFEPRCRVEIIGWVEAGRVRTLPNTKWDPLSPTWVVRPVRCKVDGSLR